MARAQGDFSIFKEGLHRKMQPCFSTMKSLGSFRLPWPRATKAAGTVCTLPLHKPQIVPICLQFSQSPRGYCPLISITWLTLTHISSAACGVCPTLYVLTIRWGLWSALTDLPPTCARNQEVSTLWGRLWGRGYLASKLSSCSSCQAVAACLSSH